MKWYHEGKLYGDDGRYVGCFYNNDDGWWVQPSQVGPGIEKTIKARSRLDAIGKLEDIAKQRAS